MASPGQPDGFGVGSQTSSSSGPPWWVPNDYWQMTAGQGDGKNVRRELNVRAAQALATPSEGVEKG